MPEVYNATPTGAPPSTPPVHTDLPTHTHTQTQTHTHPAGQDQPDHLTPKQQARALIEEVLKKTGETKRKILGGAYEVCPGSSFINEQNDEEVVLILRAHPIMNLRWMLIVAGALILPEILGWAGVFNPIPFKYVFVGKLSWYLVILGFAFEKFLSWYYSVFIVTNERLVDIDFVNLLYRVVSYANLNHIEEPAMVMGGFVRSFFKYGDIHVATAAEAPTLEAVGIPHPDKVIRIISELSEELEKRRERGE